MSDFKIIYGEAGSGKTTACFSFIKEHNANKSIIIVPEPFSFSMEKKVVAFFGAVNSSRIDVLSFERLASQVFAKFGPLFPNYIDKTKKVIILQKVLENNKKSLQLFASNAKQTDFADMLLTLFDEFQRYSFNFYDINQSNLLNVKLSDIKKIYDAFNLEVEKYIKNPQNLLDLLASRLLELKAFGINPFENTQIILDQFKSWTPQELRIIEILLELCDSVVCSLTCSNLSEKSGLFFETTQSYKELKTLAENLNCNILMPEKVQHKKSEIKKEIYKCSDPRKEIEVVAEKIVNLSKQGISPSDIAVISQDSEFYGKLIRQIFPKYNIEVFVDDTKTALSNYYIKSVLSLLDIFKFGYQSKYILKFFKTALAKIEIRDLNLLDNYAYQYKITSNQWQLKRQIKNESIAKLVQCSMQEILELGKTFEGNPSASEICQSLKKFLPSNIEPEAHEFLIEALTQIENILGKEIIPISSFISILKSALAECRFTPIPQFTNQVAFSEITRFIGQNPKVLFIVGAQEGSFPAKHSYEGIFSDSDREILKKHDMRLAQSTLEKQLAEKLVVYNCLNAATGNLILSYCSFSLDGTELIPSPEIMNLKKEGIEEKSFMTFDINEIKSEADNSANQSIKDLYKNKNTSSVSQIEQFAKCQFSYFMKYSLNIKERKKSEISAAISGNIFHKIIEIFSKCHLLGNNNIQNLEQVAVESYVDEIANKVIEEEVYENIRENPRFINYHLKTISMAKKAIWEIVNYYKTNDFKPYEFELSFGKENALPPLKIFLNNGEKVDLIGKIDRVDIQRTENQINIQVVDYKSSEKYISMKDVEAGVQVQLPAYINAICEQISEVEKATVVPANLMYFNTNPSINKEFKHKGLSSKLNIDEVCQAALGQLSNHLGKMLEGQIQVNPHSDAVCEYCPYLSACRKGERSDEPNLD